MIFKVLTLLFTVAALMCLGLYLFAPAVPTGRITAGWLAVSFCSFLAAVLFWGLGKVPR
jgi:hypothetical protein